MLGSPDGKNPFGLFFCIQKNHIFAENLYLFRMKQLLIILSAIALMAITACKGDDRKTVAVSQCSMDEWRNQMNEEMRREAFLHQELNVEYHSTADNSQEQIADIESFIARKVDAIVVAPNEEEALRPVIEKAYDSGIPVILIDRRANTNKYSAYVGGDNVEVGRQAANYILQKLPNGGNIIEIEGLASSSSSQERKQGFMEIISQHPEIKIIADVTADWQRKKAREVIDTLLVKGQKIDIVFAYNDRMAIGAWESLENDSIAFIGVDALMNDTIGVGRIVDGTLEASFLYSTGGDKAIETAAAILSGQPFEREQIMQTILVDKSNVNLMRLQDEHIKEQYSKIEFLNYKLDDFFHRYSVQRVLLITFIILVIVVCVLLGVSIRAYQTKHKLNLELGNQKEELRKQRDMLAEQKEIVESQRDQLEAERDKLVEQILKNQQQSDDSSESSTTSTETADQSPFLQRLNQIIDKNLDNSDLTVDMIGAEVGLGRVQLYRKCKAASGMSPNELLRTARLNKSAQLLKDTNLSVSEVAYSVGFSSPSYFAKCYKEHFGKNPTEEQRLIKS